MELLKVMDGSWPMPDFNKFPNNMIAGLTSHEITEVMNDQMTAEELDLYLKPQTSKFSNVFSMNNSFICRKV